MKKICLTTLAALCIPLMSNAGSRPNIVFLFADDWGRHASIYREIDGPGTVNDVIDTPNFDALAREGVLFRNAYVSSPSCTPCRSSILAGQHFWRTGTASVLRGTWDSNLPSYPLLLEANGYHMGFSYKGWSPGSPANAPFGGSRTEYVEAGIKFRKFSQTASRMVAEGKSAEDAKQVMYDEARQNFRDFLADRRAGEPFCYWFGPKNVHRKWTAGSGQKLWGMNPDKLKGIMPPFLPDVHTVRQDLNDYLGEAQAFDASIGVIIDVLKDIGEYKNTIIAISGDHGAPGFLHGKCNLYDFGTQVPLLLIGPGIQGGRVVDDLVSLPDLAPTFLEAGGVAPPAVMTGKSLWNILGSAGEGQVDPERTQVYMGRERHYITARDGNLPYPQRAIRTKDYLFIINFKPDRYPMGDHYKLNGGPEPSVKKLTESTKVTIPDEDSGPTKAWIVSNRKEAAKPFFEHAYGKRPVEELYAVKQDPYQMNNLAALPEYIPVVEKLRARLLEELSSTGDPRMVDDGKFYEEMGTNGTRGSKSKKRTNATSVQ